jgi:hypothetical protein
MMRRGKKQEIMYMDEIYFNSSLKISATEGTLDGLLLDRNILSVNPCRTVVKNLETQQELGLQAFSDKCHLWPSEGPLNKRGWVFQERTLAPRIVHFTKNQVFWECQSLEASKILPQELSTTRTFPFKKPDVFRSRPAASSRQVKRQWYELVDQYSQTSLAFADDRLLAISAIAKRCCSGMGLEPSEYLAGMWKGDLLLSLLWFQEDDSDSQSLIKTNKTEIDFAPSWSWASILAEVTYFGVGYVKLSDLAVTTTVLDTWIERRSQNFFDGANSCRLRLRGRVLKIHRHVLNDKPRLHIENQGDCIEFQEFGRLQEFRQLQDHNGKAVAMYWDTSRESVANGLNNDTESVASIYYLLHIASHAYYEEFMIRGLVLKRTERSGTSMRVGTFLASSLRKYGNSDLEKAFDGHLYTLRTDDYFEVNESGEYTIDII